MLPRDYVERMIEQVAAAVAQVLNLTRGGQVEEAEREIENAWSSLGLREDDVLRLDDTTLRTMLGTKAKLVATLLDARATLEQARGNGAFADRLRKYAAALIK